MKKWTTQKQKDIYERIELSVSFMIYIGMPFDLRMPRPWQRWHFCPPILSLPWKPRQTMTHWFWWWQMVPSTDCWWEEACDWPVIILMTAKVISTAMLPVIYFFICGEWMLSTVTLSSFHPQVKIKCNNIVTFYLAPFHENVRYEGDI